ncbi:DUF2489 domain-containing protein [Stutzerimonas kirkiae]|uniref:DUF2489 domain-containing protein n=1 Tax=Stutzerimonas kirkiae TaxID=2211392 RepID=A0A4Q9R2H8_9GAMM|nr:DUF2489 domain-containing protein [Stutzerimonas kirkiae]TBU93503.1 DUF2489 domain-containing protein [Stutzerimonas kirkiae]TBV01709.1 DUF2489 domain-containing protein [Stutzerimonas kirkiae]TBV11040.1 DUF2489 domain-containing protein [Stutzerimonas kirkiae]
MSSLVTFLYAAALLLIVALSVHAGLLWRKVWLRQRQIAQALRQRHQALAGDLRILAASLLDGQLPLIEGAIRIKVLLDSYDTGLANDPRSEALQAIHGATAHIPTHDAWKALERDEQRRHEADFRALESRHGEDARRAARWLLNEAIPG